MTWTPCSSTLQRHRAAHRGTRHQSTRKTCRTFLAICAHPWCCGYIFKVAKRNMILMLSHMPRGHAVHVTMLVPYFFLAGCDLKDFIDFSIRMIGICRAFFRRRNSCWSNLFSQEWQCVITLISITRYYPRRPQKTKTQTLFPGTQHSDTSTLQWHPAATQDVTGKSLLCSKSKYE